MKNYFTFLSGAFAALPGIAVLVTAIGVPAPDDKLLFAAVLEVLGCLTLALILLNREYFTKKISLRKLNAYIIGCTIVFFSSILIYIFLFKISVIEHDNFSRVYFPLFSSSQLKTEINSVNGKLNFIEKWYGDGANRRIHKLAGTELLISTLIFLLVYQLIFTSVTAAFGLLAVKENKLVESSQQV